jgi:hypothetical protein
VGAGTDDRRGVHRRRHLEDDHDADRYLQDGTASRQSRRLSKSDATGPGGKDRCPLSRGPGQCRILRHGTLSLVRNNKEPTVDTKSD